DQKQVALLAARITRFTFVGDTNARTIACPWRNADRALLATAIQDALCTLVGFFQRDFDRLFQVAPPNRLLISFPRASTAEDPGEEVREVRAAAFVEVDTVRSTTRITLVCHPVIPVETARILAP